MAAQGHDVQFYERDSEIVDAVARRTLNCLRDRTPVIVVATQAHRGSLEMALTSQGVDLRAAQKQGMFVEVDAADALAGFMVGNRPDPDLFDAQIGALLDLMPGRGSQPWVYGGMVGLLCGDRNAAGAMELDTLWNGLATSRQFSLLCGYPTSILDSTALEDVALVCQSHAHLVPPPGYRSSPSTPTPSSPVRVSKVFVPAAEAIGAARRFITDVLRGWGEEPRLIDDAVLLTSEMATNALVHARSPFRVSVAQTGSAITFAVQDPTSGTPQMRTVDPAAARGRGLGIVEALSSRWGCDVLLTGKVVWAELLSTSQPTGGYLAVGPHPRA